MFLFRASRILGNLWGGISLELYMSICPNTVGALYPCTSLWRVALGLQQPAVLPLVGSVGSGRCGKSGHTKQYCGPWKATSTAPLPALGLHWTRNAQYHCGWHRSLQCVCAGVRPACVCLACLASRVCGHIGRSTQRIRSIAHAPGRSGCLGAWGRWATRVPFPSMSVTIEVWACLDWLLTGYDYSTKVCRASLVMDFWYQSAVVYMHVTWLIPRIVVLGWVTTRIVLLGFTYFRRELESPCQLYISLSTEDQVLELGLLEQSPSSFYTGEPSLSVTSESFILQLKWRSPLRLVYQTILCPGSVLPRC